MFRLDKKVAIITGGGSGIGKAVSKVLARQGAAVHIIEITSASGTETIKEINEGGGTAFAYVADVGKGNEIKTIFHSIGRPDILVNCAGIAHVGNVETTSENDLDRLYNVNVKGVFNCLQAAIPLMKNNGGAITNISSIAAHAGLVDRFAYSMTKGAVHAMTLSVAKDYIKAGIRCNSISPARVHTPFVDGFIAKNYPGKEAEMFQKLSASQPIGRMGTVDEIANLVLYLSSDEAAFITGADYAIDGGFLTLNS